MKRLHSMLGLSSPCRGVERREAWAWKAAPQHPAWDCGTMGVDAGLIGGWPRMSPRKMGWVCTVLGSPAHTCAQERAHLRFSAFPELWCHSLRAPVLAAGPQPWNRRPQPGPEGLSQLILGHNTLSTQLRRPGPLQSAASPQAQRQHPAFPAQD